MHVWQEQVVQHQHTRGLPELTCARGAGGLNAIARA
jgi:hypothetical protein